MVLHGVHDWIHEYNSSPEGSFVWSHDQYLVIWYPGHLSGASQIVEYDETDHGTFRASEVQKCVIFFWTYQSIVVLLYTYLCYVCCVQISSCWLEFLFDYGTVYHHWLRLPSPSISALVVWLICQCVGGQKIDRKHPTGAQSCGWWVAISGCGITVLRDKANVEWSLTHWGLGNLNEILDM